MLKLLIVTLCLLAISIIVSSLELVPLTRIYVGKEHMLLLYNSSGINLNNPAASLPDGPMQVYVDSKTKVVVMGNCDEILRYLSNQMANSIYV